MLKRTIALCGLSVRQAAKILGYGYDNVFTYTNRYPHRESQNAIRLDSKLKNAIKPLITLTRPVVPHSRDLYPCVWEFASHFDSGEPPDPEFATQLHSLAGDILAGDTSKLDQSIRGKILRVCKIVRRLEEV